MQKIMIEIGMEQTRCFSVTCSTMPIASRSEKSD